MRHKNKGSSIKGKIIFWVMLLIMIVLSNFAHAKITYVDDYVTISERSHNLNAIKDTDYVEINGSICYVKKSIKIASSGTLRFTKTSCDEVKLYPSVTITSYGKLYFDSVKVTSYDPETGEPIVLSRENYTKQRPDIVTRSSATYVSAKHSEFAYLGYYNSTSSHWGFALRYLPRAYITNCSFHDNYFGFYTFESENVSIKNSKIYDNLEYGVDIHDFSHNIYIYNNIVYNNGNHGIILSKYNDNGRIIFNRVYDHTLNAFVKGEIRNYGTHGIMLHQESNNALLSRNEVTNNRVGIKVDESHGAIIKSNKVFSDLEEGFYIDESYNGTYKYNKVLSSDEESLYMYNSFGNYFSKNKWGSEEDIVYVKIENSPEDIQRYKFSAFKADPYLNELSLVDSLVASESSLVTLPDTKKEKSLDVKEENRNDLEKNTQWSNKKDIQVYDDILAVRELTKQEEKKRNMLIEKYEKESEKDLEKEIKHGKKQ